MPKTASPSAALLACGAVHHHLVRNEERTQIGLVLETGEAREVHHHCLLAGYGADAINPYMAFESLYQAREDGTLEPECTDEEIVSAYRKGVAKGMLKVMGKMGISTLAELQGGPDLRGGRHRRRRDRTVLFAAPPAEFAASISPFWPRKRSADTRSAIRRATRCGSNVLPNPGLYQWRKNGEKHAWNPHTIAEIQQAARAGDQSAYDRYSRLINETTTRECHLRGLLRFKPCNARAARRSRAGRLDRASGFAPAR